MDSMKPATKHYIALNLIMAASVILFLVGLSAGPEHKSALRSALFGSTSIQANLVPVTGKDLTEQLASCRHAGNACHSYILAVATGSLATTRLLEAGDLFCLPETIRDADIPVAVEIFLETNPDAIEWPSPIIVIGALQARFPCPPSHHSNR